jgi:hypothetical protein
VTHSGGCHCGSVRFEVDAPADIEADECDCSICHMSGYLHLIVPKSRFRLLRGEQAISTYTYNKRIAQHYFCRVCGVKSWYVPRQCPLPRSGDHPVCSDYAFRWHDMGTEHPQTVAVKRLISKCFGWQIAEACLIVCGHSHLCSERAIENRW